MGEDQAIAILLVADIEAKRYVTAHTLRQAGYHVIEGVTGRDCLRLAQEQPRPDLIILDVKLPDMDGFEVCRRLKSDPSTHSIPLLHLSDIFMEKENKVRGLQSGADAYLAEPANPDELIATISTLLRVRRAEEESRVLARQWQDTFDAMSDGVGVMDAQGRFVRCNQALKVLLARTENQILGHACTELDEGCPSSQGCLFLKMRDSLERQVSEHESRGRWFRLSVDPVRDERGELSGAVYVMAEITERKRAEEALRAANAQLTEADRRKDEFLAMLAHELRNPLAPVRYAVQIMAAAGLNEPRLRRQAEIIDRQVGHMARLLDDLLDVSRISRGVIVLKKEKLDLRLIAEQAIDSLNPMLEEHEHHLEYSRDKQPVWVEGDATRLEQVLGNLLSNAIKYTEPGGRIGVGVRRESSSDGDEAVVRVSDTGIGLSAEMLPHVFDLFAQADHSLDRSQGGLGIGLTMVRRLAALHGGTVGAASEGPGQGSEFTVRLPLLGEAKTERQAPDPGARGRAGRNASARRVLVVEDNRDSAESLADLLRLWGHEVCVALEGQKAIEQALAWPPDLVLLDIGLPGISGFEVARRLRAEPSLAGTIMAALTGYGQEDARERTRAAGFDRHFTKPVNLAELETFIARDVPLRNAGK